MTFDGVICNQKLKLLQNDHVMPEMRVPMLRTEYYFKV